MNELGTWKGAYEEFLWTVLEDGQSVVAEISRLSDLIPACFIDSSKSTYRSIIFDFSYFSKSEQIEKSMQAHKDLEDLFYEEHGEILIRFEQLFNAMAEFIRGMQEYCEQRGSEDLSSSWRGIDIGRELEVECVQLMSVIVLMMERKIPARARETIYVAIYRNSDERSNVEFLVDFLRAKANDLDTLFRRIKMNDDFVRGVIQLFEGGYHQMSAPSSSGHWLTRLQHRAPEILFACLFFSPKTLNDPNIMRQLVELYYRGQWVVSLGMGLVCNLLDEWQNYKAAYAAITAHNDLAKARSICDETMHRLSSIELPQGEIGPAHFKSGIYAITQYNTALRWLILHSYDIGVGRRGLGHVSAVQTVSQFQNKSLRAMLRIAKFEIEFFKTYRQYLHQKEESIKRLSGEICEMIGEMATVFTQGFQSLKVEKKTRLHDWLLLMRKTLEEADPLDEKGAEIAIHIKRRITQAGEMLDLGGNLAMGQYLEKVGSHLDTLAAAHSVDERELEGVEGAACPGYAWDIAESWIPQVQQLLLQSSNTQPVRVLFHKLSLAVSSLCSTLHSEERKKLISRAYSYQLEGRLRNILQSVPRHLFSLLQTTVIPLLQIHWPPQIDKQQVKELADFEDNYRLAEATFTISNMSVGISRMALTRVGTLEVHPRELLSDGIRRELRAQLPKTMFSKDNKVDAALSTLSTSLHSLHAAFLYMCEHVDVAGHEIWRQEVSDALHKMADDEIGMIVTETVVNKKLPYIFSWNPAVTVIGTITQMLLVATNPSTTKYLENEMVWRDTKYNTETLSINETNSIEKWVPCAAIASIDRILCLLQQRTINEALQTVKSLLANQPNFSLDEQFFTSKPFELLQKSIVTQTKLQADIAKIGQLILLRSLLLQSKRENARLRCPPLSSALQTANRMALLSLDTISDIHYLSDLLQQSAFTKPNVTKFQAPKVPSQTPLVLFISLLTSLPKLTGRSPSLCISAYLTGLRSLSLQVSCVSELLSISLLFHDSLVVSPTKQKQPAYFSTVASLLNRTLV